MAEKNQENCTAGSASSCKLLEKLLKAELRQPRIRNLAAEETLIANARSNQLALAW